MFVFAAFRTTENSFLLLFAILLIIPAVLAVWGWLRYPQVAHLAAAVFGAIVVLAALPLMFWIQSSFFLFLVAVFLVAPLIVAIKAWRRYPAASEYSGAVVAVLAVFVVLTLDTLAAHENWRIGKVKLYWWPDPLFGWTLLMYVALFPTYFGMSIALWIAMCKAQKLQPLARLTPTTDVDSFHRA
ncbi:MAG TPA: hypothetical protein VE988_07680 [Gemmataceae bacterium]|nr:hypothetical protein [Gemmataceae bacterium]